QRRAVRPGASWSTALLTWPLVDCSLTCRSLVSGSRTVRSPETLDRLMSRSPRAWRSTATAPETVRARTDPPPPSAMVRSPDTVRADRSPVTLEACTGPETLSASTRPRSPVRVISPLTVCASTGACSPPTIRLADTTRSSTRQPRGRGRVGPALPPTPPAGQPGQRPGPPRPLVVDRQRPVLVPDPQRLPAQLRHLQGRLVIAADHADRPLHDLDQHPLHLIEAKLVRMVERPGGHGIPPRYISSSDKQDISRTPVVKPSAGRR